MRLQGRRTFDSTIKPCTHRTTPNCSAVISVTSKFWLVSSWGELLSTSESPLCVVRGHFCDPLSPRFSHRCAAHRPCRWPILPKQKVRIGNRCSYPRPIPIRTASFASGILQTLPCVWNGGERTSEPSAPDGGEYQRRGQLKLLFPPTHHR